MQFRSAPAAMPTDGLASEERLVIVGSGWHFASGISHYTYRLSCALAEEYPVGTFMQLVPFEVMVKHPREKFPDTNGWEFFALELSEQGAKIKSSGAKTVNFEGVPCLSCHKPAAKFDFVCEKKHGCGSLPLDDKKIAEIQATDPRCPKK